MGRLAANHNQRRMWFPWRILLWVCALAQPQAVREAFRKFRFWSWYWKIHAAAAIRSRLVPQVGSPARSPGIGSPGNPGSIARDPGSIAREPNPIPTPGTEFDPQGLGRLQECKTGNPCIPGWWKTARIYFYGLLRVPNLPVPSPNDGAAGSFA